MGIPFSQDLYIGETRRYSPLRGFSSSSCGVLRPRLFLPGPKKSFFMRIYLIFGHFWWSVVTSVSFSSNLSNFGKKSIFFLSKEKSIQKSQKNGKSQKKQKIGIFEKISKVKKNPFFFFKKFIFFEYIFDFEKIRQTPF